MALEQAPTEQTHPFSLENATSKRKRSDDEGTEGDNDTPRSPKRHQRQTGCDLSSSKEKREAQQDMYSKPNAEARKRCRRANRIISQQALRDILRKALDTGSLSGYVSIVTLSLHRVPFGCASDYI